MHLNISLHCFVLYVVFTQLRSCITYASISCSLSKQLNQKHFQSRLKPSNAFPIFWMFGVWQMQGWAHTMSISTSLCDVLYPETGKLTALPVLFTGRLPVVSQVSAWDVTVCLEIWTELNEERPRACFQSQSVSLERAAGAAASQHGRWLPDSALHWLPQRLLCGSRNWCLIPQRFFSLPPTLKPT